MNPQDVVDTADSQTLSEEGELRLRVLAEFVHVADDFCFLRSAPSLALATSNSCKKEVTKIG